VPLADSCTAEKAVSLFVTVLAKYGVRVRP
jgi:hypothetical protein